MAFKQDANGSLTSCQICHTLYYKARTKITYALARRGFPVAVRGKRAEYWAIFDISILLLAVALGYISAQETLHCHRGGRKGEGESRDGNGSREGRIFRWLEGGQGSDWITAIRILIKFNLPPSSFLPHGWQVAGNHENRHSSLWAQGESPITLQLIGGKKKNFALMDGCWKDPCPVFHDHRREMQETLAEYWLMGDKTSLEGGQQKQREKVIPEYCIKLRTRQVSNGRKYGNLLVCKKNKE